MRLRTLLQRQRPTDLSDLALILGEYGDGLNRSRIRELATVKFERVKQGGKRSRIETNIEALKATYRETVPGLVPDAPPFADAQALVLPVLSSLLP